MLFFKFVFTFLVLITLNVNGQGEPAPPAAPDAPPPPPPASSETNADAAPPPDDETDDKDHHMKHFCDKLSAMKDEELTKMDTDGQHMEECLTAVYINATQINNDCWKDKVGIDRPTKGSDRFKAMCADETAPKAHEAMRCLMDKLVQIERDSDPDAKHWTVHEKVRGQCPDLPGPHGHGLPRHMRQFCQNVTGQGDKVTSDKDEVSKTDTEGAKYGDCVNSVYPEAKKLSEECWKEHVGTEIPTGSEMKKQMCDPEFWHKMHSARRCTTDKLVVIEKSTNPEANRRTIWKKLRAKCDTMGEETTTAPPA